MKKLQQRVHKNKLEKGFQEDPEAEFLLLYGEVAEAYDAYRKKESTDRIAEELADVAIYLLSIAEQLDIDMESALEKKMTKNESRVYKRNEKGVMEKQGE